MKKTKRYYNVLFIADVIKEAVNSLLSAADVKEIDWRTNAMTIHFPSESWDYYNEEEFYADYRKEFKYAHLFKAISDYYVQFVAI